MINRKRTKYAGTEIISVTDIEIDWEYIRFKRDGELKNTDWRFMSDQTPSQEWIDYRVFLRDLPQNYDSANDAADAWNEFIIPN
jgi:hypothetical protein